MKQKKKKENFIIKKKKWSSPPLSGCDSHQMRLEQFSSYPAMLRAMASSFGMETMVTTSMKQSVMHKLRRQLFPFFFFLLKYQNNAILRAKASKIMAP